MNSKYLLLLTSIFLLSQKGVSQNKFIDSLNTLSYKELKTGFFEYIEVDSLAKKYAEVHIKRAKKENDIIKIADSYFYFTFISDYENAIKYSDSIINLTLNSNHIYYPALGYMIKGYYYYNEGKDKKAVDEYLKAEFYAEKNNNLKQQIEIKQFIGGVKYNFGDYKEALRIFKEQLQFIQAQPDYLNDYKNDYLIALDDLSKTYLRGRETDSALIYTKEGIIQSLKNNETVMYHRFLLTSGSAYYFQGKHDQALDSLKKLQPTIKDDNRLAMCLYYKAKIYEHKKNDKAIEIFNQVDSLYQITNNPFIELRDVYKTLFNYYSANGSEKKQLESVKKLIAVDSILDINYKYSETEIVNKYDIPKLKNEKYKLEQTIEKNKNKRTLLYYLLLIIIVVSILLLIIFYRNQILYKKRYLKIISENEKNYTENKKKPKKLQKLGIPEYVVEEVLTKLDIFEQSNGFLEKGITLNSVSKKLKTNSSYLSKIVNFYKEESFTNYLNSLRIAFAIDKLKKDSKFRNYTISAIAQEVGFNTAESFSKSFFKEKGIKPSYFIKQLNKS
jgi:AraC-like DNA-binding protein